MMRPWERRLAEVAPASGALAQQAGKVLAGGTTHPLRELTPFPLAIARASGSRKWDVDGNEYVDYVVGHGALLLGHLHPAVVAALSDQVCLGTHLGGSHPAEVEWARLVCDLVGSADKVRFTSSGTEAVMLAVRAARAFTGRTRVLKFHGHFHGWSEVGLIALTEPYDGLSPGLPSSCREDVVAVHPSAEAVEKHLSTGDVAALILEPSGAHFGQVPLPEGLLPAIRESTRRHGTLLVLDEVVTGFRWAPGGAQQLYGIDPDLTTLAKVLGGGLPAGALAGRDDVMALFGRNAGGASIFHPGTFNANPLSAAAGIATLREVATGDPTARASALAGRLRDAMNGVLREAGVEGEVYGQASDFHVYLGPSRTPDRDRALAGMRGPAGAALRGAMLSRGVDLLASGGMLSAVHSDADLEWTVDAFGASVRELADEGVLPG